MSEDDRRLSDDLSDDNDHFARGGLSLKPRTQDQVFLDNFSLTRNLAQKMVSFRKMLLVKENFATWCRTRKQIVLVKDNLPRNIPLCVWGLY